MGGSCLAGWAEHSAGLDTHLGTSFNHPWSSLSRQHNLTCPGRTELGQGLPRAGRWSQSKPRSLGEGSGLGALQCIPPAPVPAGKVLWLSTQQHWSCTLSTCLSSRTFPIIPPKQELTQESPAAQARRGPSSEALQEPSAEPTWVPRAPIGVSAQPSWVPPHPQQHREGRIQ